MTTTAFSDDDAHNAEPEHLGDHQDYLNQIRVRADSGEELTGTEQHWHRLIRMSDRNHQRREASDRIQALIDADRARRGH